MIMSVIAGVFGLSIAVWLFLRLRRDYEHRTSLDYVDYGDTRGWMRRMAAWGGWLLLLSASLWLLSGQRLVVFQLALIAILGAVLFVVIMGIRRAMEEGEDRYAVLGTGVGLVLLMLLIGLIVWTLGGLI